MEIPSDLVRDDSITLTIEMVREDVPSFDLFAYVNVIVATLAEFGAKFRIADVESFPNVEAAVKAISCWPMECCLAIPRTVRPGRCSSTRSSRCRVARRKVSAGTRCDVGRAAVTGLSRSFPLLPPQMIGLIAVKAR
jgi:acyl carrier protein